MLSFCSFNFSFHTCGNRISEHPQFHALAHQHKVHEDCSFTLFRNSIVHKLREINVGSNRQIMPVHCKTAVFTCIFNVGVNAAVRIWGTDIYDRVKSGGLLRRTFFPFYPSKCLIFCWRKIPLRII